MSQILVPGVEFCQEGVVGLGHGGRLRGFVPVAFHIVLHGSESRVSAYVAFHGCCPRTAARVRSAQGASQFAAGYAAVRFTHHSDDRPVHIMKTS